MFMALRGVLAAALVLLPAGCVQCNDAGSGGGLLVDIVRADDRLLDLGQYRLELDADSDSWIVTCQVDDGAASCTVDPSMTEDDPWSVVVDVHSARSQQHGFEIHLSHREDVEHGTDFVGPQNIDIRIYLGDAQITSASFTPEYKRTLDTPGRRECGAYESATETLILD